MLFASTVINYIDRQTLANLAPYLKVEYQWTNTDYAMLVIAFRVAYSLGQTVFGRVIDRIGTRVGLTIAVIGYSLASMLTSFARGFYSLAGLRFLLGACESPNWPAATRTVAEWFPRRERGLATGLFDSGSSIGGAIAPLLIVPVYLRYGWAPAVIVPGLLGFVWVVVWLRISGYPETHPRITAAEQEMLQRDKRESELAEQSPGNDLPQWHELLRYPQTWGTIVARSFSDPVWFFIADWFAIYLVSRGFRLESTLIGIWIPFVAADLGNIVGGWISDRMVRNGMPVGRARKMVILCGGIGMLGLIPTIYTSNFFAIVSLFAVATFSYACYSTMAIVLPADLYVDKAVATVSGLNGTAAGIGTIASSLLIGIVSDRYSFEPILIAGSIIPFIGAILVLILIRNSGHPDTSSRPILKRI